MAFQTLDVRPATEIDNPTQTIEDYPSLPSDNDGQTSGQDPAIARVENTNGPTQGLFVHRLDGSEFRAMVYFEMLHIPLARWMADTFRERLRDLVAEKGVCEVAGCVGQDGQYRVLGLRLDEDGTQLFYTYLHDAGPGVLHNPQDSTQIALHTRYHSFLIRRQVKVLEEPYTSEHLSWWHLGYPPHQKMFMQWLYEAIRWNKGDGENW